MKKNDDVTHTSEEKLALPNATPEPDAAPSSDTNPPTMTIVQAIKSAVEHFLKDDCLTMAAATSYYILFSLPAILMLLFRALGSLVDANTLSHRMQSQLMMALGEDVAKQVVFLLEEISKPSDGSSTISIVGIGALLFAATGGFAKLQETLNNVWNVKPDPNTSTIRTFLVKRVLSFLTVGLIFALASASILLTSVVTFVAEFLKPILPADFNGLFVVLSNLTVTFVVLSGLFAAMFKLLPDVQLAWRDVRLGGFITASLFMVGNAAMGFYIRFGDVGSGFGAASSMAILLVWMYYSLIIVFFGAELTRAFVTRSGRDIQPDDGAILREPHDDLEPNKTAQHTKPQRPNA